MVILRAISNCLQLQLFFPPCFTSLITRNLCLCTFLDSLLVHNSHSFWLAIYIIFVNNDRNVNKPTLCLDQVLSARQQHFDYTTPDRSRQEMIRTKTPAPTEHWHFTRSKELAWPLNLILCLVLHILNSSWCDFALLAWQMGGSCKCQAHIPQKLQDMRLALLVFTLWTWNRFQLFFSRNLHYNEGAYLQVCPDQLGSLWLLPEFYCMKMSSARRWHIINFFEACGRIWCPQTLHFLHVVMSVYTAGLQLANSALRFHENYELVIIYGRNLWANSWLYIGLDIDPALLFPP